MPGHKLMNVEFTAKCPCTNIAISW